MTPKLEALNYRYNIFFCFCLVFIIYYNSFPVKSRVENVETILKTPSLNEETELYFYTGTHLSVIFQDQNQSECSALSNSLAQLFMFFSNTQLEHTYSGLRQKVLEQMRLIKRLGKPCKIHSFLHSNLYGHFSFPLSYLPGQSCNENMIKTLNTKSFIKGTKVYEPWLLLTPNLKVISELTEQANLKLKIVANISDSFKDAAFTLETCSRFRTVFGNFSQYATTYHAVIKSDILKQLEILQSLQVNVQVYNKPRLSVKKALTFQKKKTKFVFIAGLEGAGHHMFSKIGRHMSYENIYIALTEFLTETSSSFKAGKKNNLIETLKKYDGKDEVIFLNTVFTTHPVNMYSFPWGGPKCLLKKFARNVCNIDLYELGKLFSDSDLNLKVIVLQRSFGASIVSATVNRKFGTVVSESKLLAQSWSFLSRATEYFTPENILFMQYEDVAMNVNLVTSTLCGFLDLDVGSLLCTKFSISLKKAANIIRQKQDNWTSKLSPEQLVLVKDEFSARFLRPLI